ncbi:MAG: hypothetical protein D6785_05700, partial [Planctomycetota bacterium]
MKRFWILITFILLSGCSSFSLSSSDSQITDSSDNFPMYLSSSQITAKYGWSRLDNQENPTFLAGDHQVVLELGTRYAMVDGKMVFLKKPLYS